jgi:predicted acetyltransferase
MPKACIEPTQITLQLATRAQESILANLLELYMHDMSEAFPLRISDEGRFGYAWLPTYWAEPERRFPYLIRSENAGLLGFVLTTIGSPGSEDPDALDVAEFFVLRRFRRSKVGTTAIQMLWDQRPGHWVVRVSEGNPEGRSFWPNVVSAYTGGVFEEKRIPGRHYHWRVYELESRTRR